jgi:acetyl esterase/lipase
MTLTPDVQPRPAGTPRRFRAPLIIAGFALAVTAPLLAADTRSGRDLSYSEPAKPANQEQTLDIYAPREGKRHPVVFWIHGGGWQRGDKSEVAAKPQAFVDRGYVFVSTNYRLLPRVTIGQMAEDVAKGIRWTRDHAAEYGGDPRTLFVAGHSAGAQLAALVCTDERYLQAEGLSLTHIKGCIPVDGDTYDVPLQIATVEERRANIYRMKFGDAERQKALSPVTHVARGKPIPPVLIIHVAEHPETKLQSQRLVRALQEAGRTASAFPAVDTDHVKLDANLGLPNDVATKALFEFLERTLARK